MSQLIGYLSEGEQLKGSLTIPQKIGGGGGGNLQDKTVNITPTESAQSQMVTADPGYDGLGEVGVNVGAISGSYVGSQVPRKSSSDLTASGATVTAPAGYYESAANKAVASGTEGTPTATKGSVSNHSVNVTPSVTNVAGYIAGGTKTGTAVTVSASELVSGTKSITSNGTGIDVTNYASADVNVPNSYSAGDEGKVVSNGALVAQTSQSITENGTYDTTLKNQVVVNVAGGGGGYTPSIYLGGLSNYVTITGNHVRIDAGNASGNVFVNLRTMSFQSSGTAGMSNALWYSVSAGSVVKIEYTNVINTNNKVWNANIKRVNTSTSLGYGVGNDTHLTGASVTVTPVSDEDWGTLFVYIESVANATLEFDVTITVDGVRIL